MKPVLLSTLYLLLFISCNDNKEDGTGLTTHDRDFLKKITYINIGETALGIIARDSATDPAVANYGNMMADDHSKAHSDLYLITSELEYALPDSMDEDHKALEELLLSLDGRQFDSTYIHKMAAGHTRAIVLYEAEIDFGNNTRLREYAMQNLPVVRHHKHMADSIAMTLFP